VVTFVTDNFLDLFLIDPNVEHSMLTDCIVYRSKIILKLNLFHEFVIFSSIFFGINDIFKYYNEIFYENRKIWIGKSREEMVTKDRIVDLNREEPPDYLIA